MKIKSFEGGYDKNLCYLAWCKKTKIAAIIDPSVEILPIFEFIESHDLILDKILITHTHHDHIVYLNDILNFYPLIKVYASKNALLRNFSEFIKLENNEVITIGENLISSLSTPGHYLDSICYWIKDKNIIFTGDTMFVGRTGRTISSGSNISDLYRSIYKILLKLPGDTIIYPGHNYGFSKTISIDDNIKYSIFFQCQTLNEFKIVMKNYENQRKK